jgi:hypothetical protein
VAWVAKGPWFSEDLTQGSIALGLFLTRKGTGWGLCWLEWTQWLVAPRDLRDEVMGGVVSQILSGW